MNRRKSCIVERSATPEYVLEVMRDSYRQQVEYDPEAEPGIDLCFETTVSEWRNTCDLVSWKPLGKALASEWRFTASDSEWKNVLEPSEKRQLGDVCQFIASKATRYAIVPSRLLGPTCHSGGTFLAVREMLMKAGAEASVLRPSDAIAPYLKNHAGVFLGPISGLTPNRLPLIKCHDSAGCFLTLLFLAALISTAVFGIFDLTTLRTESAAVAVLCFMLRWLAPSAYFDFPGIVTFRDLVEHMQKDRAASNNPKMS